MNPTPLLTATRVDGTSCDSFGDTSSFPETTAMAKRVETRLVTLERRVPVGCPTCRVWSTTILGDEDGSRSRPEVCPECGRTVPIHTVVIIANVPWSAV
jgi:hypothetical protein